MSKKRHRSRSRSRSRSKHGRRSDPEKSPPPSAHKRPRTSNEEQDSLSAILKTLQEVQQDLKHTNDRVSSMEKHWHQNLTVFPPDPSVETDTLSVMVHSDEDLALSDSEGLVTALKPPARANEPPTRANEPPTEVSEPQSGVNKPPNEAEGRPNAPNVSSNGGDLYDPDSQQSSWEPKANFTAFLEKHFRRKLTYDQVSDILDSYSIPSVDCLFSPTLDNSVLNQISPLKSRKYTQERDKELASVQRSMLNTTGPLCCLHDALCSDQEISKDDIKLILEQSLCLLGSANFQFSALRRKKILVAINKEKIGLADQPLPNAKRKLFGDDFPSIASKQADLSRGLAKNLGAASRPAKRPRSGPSRPPNKDKPFAGSYSKYNNRPKNGRSFRVPKQEAKESTHS